MLPAKNYRYLDEMPEEYIEPVREHAPARSVRQANKHVGMGRQIVSVLFILSVATVCLALVGGYEKLALAHQSNVRLKQEIADAKNYIEDLTVELEYSMDLQSVEEIASKRLSMDYPKADQLVAVSKPVIPKKAETDVTVGAQDDTQAEADAGADEGFKLPEVEKAFDETDTVVIGLDE